jgi:hypothetical protein
LCTDIGTEAGIVVQRQIWVQRQSGAETQKINASSRPDRRKRAD